MNGIGVSYGVGIGNILKVERKTENIKKLKIDDVDKEIKKLDNAISVCIEDTKKLFEITAKNIGDKEAEIFYAHELILQDEIVFDEIKALVTNQKINCEYAVKKIFDNYIKMIENIDDEFMIYRADDLKDIFSRLTKKIIGTSEVNFSQLKPNTVIVAKDLSPSETAHMDIANVSGIILEKGGKTSHVAIIAKTLEIPTVVGVDGIFDKVQDNDLIICDGMTGEIFTDPKDKILEELTLKKKIYESRKIELKIQKGLETITTDGFSPKLEANIGLPSDISYALDNDAEGIGLTRTEFIYMSRDRLPTEEEQFIAYKEIIEKLGNKSVIIRTLDVGGDKNIDYLDIPKEENPFLGYRAIRLCLEQTDIFKTQLRAIIRAGAHGNIKIMFPMISNLEELKAAKKLYFEAKEELINEGFIVGNSIQLGIMIEIPSAAVLADVLAREVDFFSIGTNDLMQYMLAADRMNSRISYLYNQCDPAVLRLIRYVIQKGHEAGIMVGMCGDMASSSELIPLLIGMGLDEFSMPPSSILSIRKQIRQLKKSDCELMLEEALKLGTAEEIKQYLTSKSLEAC